MKKTICFFIVILIICSLGIFFYEHDVEIISCEPIDNLQEEFYPFGYDVVSKQYDITRRDQLTSPTARKITNRLHSISDSLDRYTYIVYFGAKPSRLYYSHFHTLFSDPEPGPGSRFRNNKNLIMSQTDTVDHRIYLIKIAKTDNLQ